MISEPTMELAVKTARSSPSRKRVGAVLLNKNKVVVTATNLDNKTHPLQAKFARLVVSEPPYCLNTLPLLLEVYGLSMDLN